jgi:hypothetical protein
VETSPRAAAVAEVPGGGPVDDPARQTTTGSAAGRDINQIGSVHGDVYISADRPDQANGMPVPVKQDFSAIFDRFRNTGFTERPWLTNQIQAFLDDSRYPQGYFFVEGKTGVGKTTLAAELILRYGYSHHFCSDDESSQISVALSSLAAQLMDQYGLSAGSQTAAESPVGFQSLLREAADAAAARDEQVVLVIDGLDQAERRADTLPLGLPAELPDNVYVIATLREGILLDQRRQRSAHVTIDPYESHVLDDIRRHVDTAVENDEALRARVTKTMTTDQFRETIVARCGGVWIYVSIVLADIRAGWVPVDAVPDLPTELWTYYSRTLRELEAAENGDLCRPVLSTLACAAEPLPLSTLCTLADVTAERREDVKAMAVGRLRSFVTIIGHAIEGLYTLLHDSARAFLNGWQPDTDTPMTGDWQRLADLADTAVETHCRIADRYLTAWGDLSAGLPDLTADLKLGQLDGGYGQRHIAAHLEYAGRQDDLHLLLDHYSWYAAHQEQLMYAEYRADLMRARRLAAQHIDRVRAAGETAPMIAREIRYALMDASIESISASMTPGLLCALVEQGLVGPVDAARHIRSVVDYPTRVEMVASLMQVRYRPEHASLAERAATHTWDLVFPPRTARSWKVAGEVLRHLPTQDRERHVSYWLPYGLDPNFPQWGLVLGLLAASLSAVDLERATYMALSIKDDRENAVKALTGLVPHLPDSLLVSLDNAGPYVPGVLELRRIIALRLANSCHARSEWAISYLVHEVRQLIQGSGNQEIGWRADHLETLVNGLESSRRIIELDKIVDVVVSKTRSNQFPGWTKDGARFLSEQQVQRIIAVIPRKPIGYSFSYARAWLLPGVPERRRPKVVAEILRALRKTKSDLNLFRGQTLLFLAPHVTGEQIAETRVLADIFVHNSPITHATLLAILSSRSTDLRESSELRYQAVRIVASCPNKLRAEAIEGIAPYLDRETRHTVLDLVSSIEPGGIRKPRHRALDALVAQVQSEGELHRARSVAARIHDPLAQATALAGMARHVEPETRGRIRSTIEHLVESTDSRACAGPLIMLARSYPDTSTEHHQILRRAARLIPADRLVGDRQRVSEYLAAVRSVLTLGEVYDRLLSTAGDITSEPWEGLDIWNALTPIMSSAHLSQTIKATLKQLKHAGGYETAQTIAMCAPHLHRSEIDQATNLAEQCHEAYRAMPLAALVHHLKEPRRSWIIRQILDDIRPRDLGNVNVIHRLGEQPLNDMLRRGPGSPGVNILFRLTSQLLEVLASAMTDKEREDLIEIISLQRPKEALVLLAALVNFFPQLPQTQQNRVMAAARDALPETFFLEGPDFRKIVRHADTAFLRRILEAARSSTEDLKAEAITAILESAATVDHGSWITGGNDVFGPLRDLFTGLTRPSLLNVLGAAAPHIAVHGGARAVEECVAAVGDVAQWWP